MLIQIQVVKVEEVQELVRVMLFRHYKIQAEEAVEAEVVAVVVATVVRVLLY